MKLLLFLGLTFYLAAVSSAAEQPPTPEKWKITFYTEPDICHKDTSEITSYLAYDGDSSSNQICENIALPPASPSTTCSYFQDGGHVGPGPCNSEKAWSVPSLRVGYAMCDLYSVPDCSGRMDQRITVRDGWTCLDGVTVKSFRCAVPYQVVSIQGPLPSETN